MARRFEGKVVLVFGAGSSGPGWGNGKAAAALYAREGVAVVAVDRDLAAANETRDVIHQEGGVVSAQVADATKSADILRVVQTVMALHGRIDVLHNNVGATEMGDPVELEEDAWHRSIDTNLTSVFLTCMCCRSWWGRAAV